MASQSPRTSTSLFQMWSGGLVGLGPSLSESCKPPRSCSRSNQEGHWGVDCSQLLCHKDIKTRLPFGRPHTMEGAWVPLAQLLPCPTGIPQFQSDLTPPFWTLGLIFLAKVTLWKPTSPSSFTLFGVGGQHY